MVATTLYDGFADMADRYPDATALEVRQLALTYRELREAALALATWILTEHSGTAPTTVGLLADHSAPAYVGYLAAQRLGAAVVPLNPRFPLEGNIERARLASAEVVLADRSSGGGKFHDEANHFRPTVIELADPDVVALARCGGLPPYTARPEDVAYILFTSGSTGRPKGVPIRQRNLQPWLRNMINRYQTRPGIRFSQNCDLSFDASLFFFAAWWSGGTVVVPQNADLMSPADYAADKRITHWFLVPSIVDIAQRLGTLDERSASRLLRYSVFGGEQLTLQHSETWLRVFPRTEIDNGYGPTELTITCASYRLPGDPGDRPRTSNGAVPIGQVYPYLEHVVLDESGHAAAEGELCVRGSQRFDGYLDPSDNADRFVIFDGIRAIPHEGGPVSPRHWYRTGDVVRTEQGQLLCLGRLDDQVKVSGYRVELGEVETAVRRHLGAAQAVAIALTSPGGSSVLAVAHTGEALDAQDAIRRLRAHLPVHAIPRRFLPLTELPVNVNGKVDRWRITQMFEASDGAGNGPQTSSGLLSTGDRRHSVADI